MLRTSGILPHYGRLAGRTTLRLQHSFALTRLQTRTRTSVFYARPLATVTRRTLHTAMQKPLDFYAGPLVWIDCEMTGLDPRKDKILEIAVSRIHTARPSQMDG
jgi:DNA polymerase III epsilon subunit-like protein